jgi:glycosyltransferase involved in cell wall biosynthesis
MMKPKISFVMPVLNNRRGFSCAIESILEQGDLGVELIVIDGGSTDGTLEVINSYSDKITYWESGLDSGIADAFNRGIKHATGDIIGILNSDDVLEFDALKSLIEIMEQQPEPDIYYGSIRYYDPKREYKYIRKPALGQMYRRMSIFHPALFIRRSCYERIGLYDSNYTHAMDSELCHRALAAEMVFCEVPAVLATMALGGVSDVEYRKSLQQYRNSVIKHGLANPVAAYSYYFFYLLVKTFMRLPMMRPIKRLRDVLLEVSK